MSYELAKKVVEEGDVIQDDGPFFIVEFDVNTATEALRGVAARLRMPLGAEFINLFAGLPARPTADDMAHMRLTPDLRP